ncbi:MAG: DUF4860 domain-containing protein [Lachnospiraceae bacterium]|nr:DUF4860 domain-containing protein [Lachnospiraceae bacterium]
MNIDENRHVIDILFLIALLGVFAISSALLILSGTNIYRNIVSSMEQNYDARTSYAYLTQRMHSLDTANAVSVETVDSVPVISISETINDKDYNTLIYAYDGSIRELFTTAGNDIPLSAGQEIMACESFTITQVGDKLYTIHLQTAEDEAVNLMIATHSDQSEGTDQ